MSDSKKSIAAIGQTMGCLYAEINRLTAENEALREEVERLRERRNEIDNEAFEYAEQVEELKQERDQLRADNQSMQMKHDLLLAKIEAIQLRDCQRDADVIEWARNWVQQHQPNMASEYNLLLSQYANQLRQQAKEVQL